jgi:[ribosomal protein S18]-alanine N-acetyltransferase
MSVLARLLERAGAGGPTVEPMRPRHLHQIMAIERVSYPRPWTTQVFHDELEQVRAGRRYYIVGRSGRSVVGYGGAMFAADEAHVTNVAVHPEHRRTGVATMLLGELANEAIRRGAAAWTLEVRASNRSAQDLYRKFGFVPAGVRTRYYEGQEDAIVMWCQDIQSGEYAQRLADLQR